jgi:hypothetical protein
MLVVADSNAGQLMRCPECKEMFSVPALASDSPSVRLPDDLRLSPPEREASAKKDAAAEPDHHSVYTLAPEPARPVETPPPPPPRREERASGGPLPAPKAAAPKAPPKPPKPPAPATYEHELVVGFNHLVIPWITPIALALVLFLWFFNWVGLYPGGYGVYTQNPFQAMLGLFSVDPVGEKVMHMEEQIAKDISSNLLLFLHLIVLLAALVIAAVPLFTPKPAFALPPSLQQLWPWRVHLLTGVCALLFLLMLLQLSLGFGLENAVAVPIGQELDKSTPALQTQEDLQQLRIRRGMALGRLNVRHTVWLSLAGFLEVVAIAGAGLELWISRRGPKPLPLVQVHW